MRTDAGARSLFGGPRRTRLPRVPLLLGPALVAGVAYLDPGNVASNTAAGAAYGYLLVWVVVAANVIAWLVQYLSAKLGVVTGRSLPEHLGTRIRRPWARRAYWLQAELVAIATDVAEVIGGAVALNLLFGLPLAWGGLITGAVSLLLLAVHARHGARMFEVVIIALVAVIAVGFVVGVVVAPPAPGPMAAGLVPRFNGAGSVLLAASILGATVMPHAIYAHSSLTRDRFAGSTHTAARLVRATRWDVTIAMTIAGAVNVCILLLAAANVPHGTTTLNEAYDAIRASIGPIIATMFAVGLLASGLASTAVGAYAGGEIMHGLLHVRVPLIARRLVSLVPALALLMLGADPTRSLVLSQVVLSFGIPFALVPLVALTARREVLGAHRNHPVTTGLAVAAAALLIVLNVALLWLTFRPA
ncbi:MAG TPA: Nramp family divalent metal transporter [Microbacterium sp.]|uniref:Nramp family divalent metal transporter n=1 Tax=Microbacterium sp. TaxID=51671 RepID=UPI002B47CE44|nr:Nramp family divalent metal transporter [Microbacterium sp.]HKT57914.1 Nramp family divalent metal transporter [Microbacterium sp.]